MAKVRCIGRLEDMITTPFVINVAVVSSSIKTQLQEEPVKRNHPKGLTLAEFGNLNQL